MAGLDLPFSVDTGNTFEETMPDGTAPEQVPVLMAEGKSRGFHRALAADEVLVTADTVVIVDGAVLGKPHSRQRAVEMLRALSGRTHEVITAVTIRDCNRSVTISDSTMVSFDKLEDSEIDYYIDKYRPFDKAGAYGIQEWIGYVAISAIQGSFYNVMGFPVHKVWQQLKKFL